MPPRGRPPQHRRTAHRRRSLRLRRVVAAFLALFLLGGFAFGIVVALGGSPAGPALTATSTTTLPPTSTLAPSSSIPARATTSSSLPHATTTTSSTSTTTTTTTTTTTIATVAPSGVLVEVLNGFGGKGAASAAAAALQQVGFAINGTGDAASFTYGNSVIEYPPGEAAAAETLLHHVRGTTELDEVDSLPAANEVELILGSTYDGVFD